jgi:hypothetical protein
MRIRKYDGPGMQVTRRACRAGAALALVVLVASSCSRLEITGRHPENQRPELILVNVPPGGLLLGANPTVYWYGTDIDGRIVRYDYAVVTEDAVKGYLDRHNNCSQGGTDAERFIQCAVDSMPWVSIFVDSTGSVLPTQEKIPLYASFDTLDCDSVDSNRFIPPDSFYIETVPVNCVSMAVPQYMFIRAIDDQGENSVIKYRSFLRNNHWPVTALSPSFDPWRTYFSIPSLSETYRGIEVRWTGSDRSDFLRDQPDLEYHWRVYGPYPIGQRLLEDRPNLRDTILFTTPIWESRSSDPRKGVWVKDTVAAVYDLWREVDRVSGPSDTTRNGYFLIVVQSRDDASVSDPKPAWTTFEAVYPRFERKLLLVDETAYTISPGGYPSWNPNRGDDGEGQKSDTNRAFLARIAKLVDANIQGAHDSWKPELDYWQRIDQRSLCSTERCSIIVPLTELSKHEMVLYCDDDIIQPVTKNPDMRGPLAEYLDIGGKLWLVSRVGFLNGTDIGPRAGARVIDFLADQNFFAPRYFGIAGVYFAGWYAAATDSMPTSNDEFIGADAISSNDPALQMPSNLPPRLDVDSLRVEMHWVPLRQFLTTDVIRGVPAVGYMVRWTDEAIAPATRPLYLFESWRPGFSPADERLIAVRAVGPTMQIPKYKTAYMGCPLWFFKENEDQIYKYVAGMTDWFYNHDIQEGP